MQEYRYSHQRIYTSSDALFYCFRIREPQPLKPDRMEIKNHRPWNMDLEECLYPPDIKPFILHFIISPKPSLKALTFTSSSPEGRFSFIESMITSLSMGSFPVAAAAPSMTMLSDIIWPASTAILSASKALTVP